MIVDAHQHFWRYDPCEYDWIDDRMAALRRDFMPADLTPHLAQAGLQAAKKMTRISPIPACGSKPTLAIMN